MSGDTSSGLAAGMLVLACGPAPAFPSFAPLAMLFVDTALVAAAYRAHPAHPPQVPVHPGVFERRRQLVALRVLLVDLAPATLLLAYLPVLAAACMMAGLVVDRFTFYGVAAMRSTEAEMACLESVITRR